MKSKTAVVNFACHNLKTKLRGINIFAYCFGLHHFRTHGIFKTIGQTECLCQNGAL